MLPTTHSPPAESLAASAQGGLAGTERPSLVPACQPFLIWETVCKSVLRGIRPRCFCNYM